MPRVSGKSRVRFIKSGHLPIALSIMGGLGEGWVGADQCKDYERTRELSKTGLSKGSCPKIIRKQDEAPYMRDVGGFGTRPYGLTIGMVDFWDSLKPGRGLPPALAGACPQYYLGTPQW